MAKRDENLSTVKQLILTHLRKGAWVSSSALLKATKQKYFDRRIRELRDELGFDIETGFKNGEAHYRLRSNARSPSKIRTYLGAKEKKALLARLPQHCALCSKPFSKEKKSVLDHRKPLLRGGDGKAENFQLLCFECNNQKRTQCRGCQFDCAKCYLAFPEKFPQGVVVRIESNELRETLENQAKVAGVSPEEQASIILNNFLKSKN